MAAQPNVCLLRVGITNNTDSRIILKNGITTVGREKTCGIVVKSEYCSKIHCQIKVAANKITIKDLNSSNGTYVNNHMYQGDEIVLHVNDKIGFGCYGSLDDCLSNKEFYVYCLKKYQLCDVIDLSDNDSDNDDVVDDNGGNDGDKAENSIEMPNAKEKKKDVLNNNNSKTPSTPIADVIAISDLDSDEESEKEENENLQLQLSQLYVDDIKRENEELDELCSEYSPAYVPTIINTIKAEPKEQEQNAVIVKSDPSDSNDIVTICDSDEDEKLENWVFKLSQKIKTENKEESKTNIREDDEPSSSKNKQIEYKQTDVPDYSDNMDNVEEGPSTSNRHQILTIVDQNKQQSNTSKHHHRNTRSHGNKSGSRRDQEKTKKTSLSSIMVTEHPTFLESRHKISSTNDSIFNTLVNKNGIAKPQQILKRRVTLRCFTDFEENVTSKRRTSSDTLKQDEKLSSLILRSQKHPHEIKLIAPQPIKKRRYTTASMTSSKNYPDASESSKCHLTKDEKKNIQDDRKTKLAEIALAQKKEERESKVRVVSSIRPKVTWKTRSAALAESLAAGTKPPPRRKSQHEQIVENPIPSGIKASNIQDLELRILKEREEQERLFDEEETRKRQMRNQQTTSDNKNAIEIATGFKKPKRRISLYNQTEAPSNISPTDNNEISFSSIISSIGRNEQISSNIGLTDQSEVIFSSIEKEISHPNPNIEQPIVVETEEDVTGTYALNMDETTFKVPQNYLEKCTKLDKPPHQCIVILPKKSMRKEKNVETTSKSKKSVTFSQKIMIHIFEKSNDDESEKLSKNYKTELQTKELELKYRQLHTKSRREAYDKQFQDFLSSVTKWDVKWLGTENPPINGSSPLVPVLSDFKSIEEFQSIMVPLMTLELWESVNNDYKKSKNSPRTAIELISSNRRKRGTGLRHVLECQAPSRGIHARKGYIVEVEFRSQDTFYEFLAYITECTSQHGNSKIDHFIMETADTPITAHLSLSPDKFSFRPVSYIRSDLDQFNVIYLLKLSPLLENILHPHLNSIKPRENLPVQYSGCDKLNPEQLSVLRKIYWRCLDPRDSNITLLDGPPGTGKSRVIVNLILQLIYGREVKARRRILVCAHSNTAVDVICKRLLQIRLKLSEKSYKFKMVRFGVDDKMDKDVLPYSIKSWITRNGKYKEVLNSLENNKKTLLLKIKAVNLSANKNEKELNTLNQKLGKIDETIKSYQNQIIDLDYSQCLNGADIICTTLGSCNNMTRFLGNIDVCIVDEATQCSEPSTLSPLQFGISALILVGDTQQLGPTILSKKAVDMCFSHSLFKRIQDAFIGSQKSSNFPVLRLRTQYRMEPEICRWPSKYFYDNTLKSDDTTIDETFPLKPYTVIHVRSKQNQNGETNSKAISNDYEADFVVGMLKEMIKKVNPVKYSYGVITPYAEQKTRLMSKMTGNLSRITVNTIDSYQGLEKDIIIISFARTNGIGFLELEQRLNVALTRARKCLILCGNFTSFNSSELWTALLDDAKDRKCFHLVSNNVNYESLCTKILYHKS